MRRVVGYVSVVLALVAAPWSTAHAQQGVVMRRQSRVVRPRPRAVVLRPAPRVIVVRPAPGPAAVVVVGR
jgi:hypothetical protein